MIYFVHSNKYFTILKKLGGFKMTDKEIDVKEQNKKNDPNSTDKENVYNHDPKNADYKKAD